MDNKLIRINPDVIDFDIKINLYSAIKEVWADLSDDYGYVKYEFPIRSIGGDPTTLGQTAGDVYFLVNGYRVIYDVTKVKVTGILFSDDFDTPWVQTGTLTPVYPATVSSLALSVTKEIPSEATIEATVDVSAIAAAVWASVSRTLTEAAGVTANDITAIADAVWDEPAIEHIQAGSTGNTLNSVDNIQKEVFLDSELVDAGDGTQHRPFNTLVAALDYAELNNIYNIAIHSDVILDRNLKNFAIRGIGLPEIDCNGVDLKNSEFSRVKFKGQYVDSVIVENSVLLEGSFLNGVFSNCVIDGLATCIDGSTVLVKDCASNIAGTGRPSISMNAIGTSKLSVRGWQGGLNITDCNNVLDAVTVGIDTGSLTFTNTCSAGTMVARGVGVFVDNTTGASVTNETVYNSTVASAVWDKLATDHTISGTFGAQAIETAIDAEGVRLSVSQLNNFNPALDPVANVTTVTTNLDMRGTDDALLAASYTAPDNASIAAILVDTNDLQTNQGTVDLTPIQTVVDAILVDTNELQLNYFKPATDTVANVTTVTTNLDMRGTDNALLSTSYVAPDNVSIAAILVDTNDLQINQGTVDLTPIQTVVDAILVDTNELQLNYFKPATDTVANVTTVTTNLDMRGTDDALLSISYVIPDNIKIEELHKLQGLDPNNPMTVTPGSRNSGNISQVITGNGVSSSTVTRV